MGPYEQVVHLLNFVAPAWSLALVCALATRGLARWGMSRAPWSLGAQTLVGGLLGSAVLAGGVVLWGSDGKMATYGALVLVCATVQWLMCLGWRR